MKYILLFGLLILKLLAYTQEISNTDSTKVKYSNAVIYYGDEQLIEQEPTQNRQQKQKTQGELTLIEEDSLSLLIEGYREQKEIEGYKIQLYSGRSRMEAVKVKSSFHSKYGESESAEILYQQPNFKIRVGNYRDRLAANKWLAIYKIDFPSSFLVKDVIKLNHDK